MRSFFEDTVASLGGSTACSTDLLGTLSAYLDNNCNMAATAQAIHAHRHTVGYRLERVKELSGLDPLKSEEPAARARPEGLPHHRAVAAALSDFLEPLEPVACPSAERDEGATRASE